MTNIRDVGQTRGTVFDLTHAMSLSESDCNVLLVSSRTLYFVQQFGLGEMGFESRYASSFLSGGRYVLAQTQAELDDIGEIINRYGLEVVEMTCDIVAAINGVQSAIINAGSNACACGTVGETLETTSGTPGGIPPEGFGEPDPAVTDRLCKAANVIHASVVDAITELEASPVEGYLSLGFGVVAGLVSAIIAAAFVPIVGLLVVGVAGTVISVTLALLVSGVNLTSLLAELIASRDDLICALVEATSATGARDDYLAVLTAAGQSAQNTALIGAILNNNVLDLMWFSTSDSEAFLSTYVPPYDCAACSQPFTHTFDFALGALGWTNGAAWGRPFGVYVIDCCWISQWGDISGTDDERLYLTRLFSNVNITEVEVFYTVSGPSGAQGNTAISTLITTDVQEPWPCTDCDFEHLYVVAPPDNTGEIRVSAVANAPAAGGTAMIIAKIIVKGVGVNPF